MCRGDAVRWCDSLLGSGKARVSVQRLTQFRVHVVVVSDDDAVEVRAADADVLMLSWGDGSCRRSGPLLFVAAAAPHRSCNIPADLEVYELVLKDMMHQHKSVDCEAQLGTVSHQTFGAETPASEGAVQPQHVGRSPR